MDHKSISLKLLESLGFVHSKNDNKCFELTAAADIHFIERDLVIFNDNTQQIITELVALAKKAFKIVVLQRMFVYCVFFCLFVCSFSCLNTIKWGVLVHVTDAKQELNKAIDEVILNRLVQYQDVSIDMIMEQFRFEYMDRKHKYKCPSIVVQDLYSQMNNYNFAKDSDIFAFKKLIFHHWHAINMYFDTISIKQIYFTMLEKYRKTKLFSNPRFRNHFIRIFWNFVPNGFNVTSVEKVLDILATQFIQFYQSLHINNCNLSPEWECYNCCTIHETCVRDEFEDDCNLNCGFDCSLCSWCFRGVNVCHIIQSKLVQRWMNYYNINHPFGLILHTVCVLNIVFFLFFFFQIL